MKIRTYSELVKLPTFQERFEYLRLNGVVGKKTFGFDRYMNQIFYKSKEWRAIRRDVIIRDNGCDLGVEGYEILGCKLGDGDDEYEIPGTILIHHMNPIVLKDIIEKTDILLNPEYLITTVLGTHNAIHYGNSKLLPAMPIERRANDTCPWKQK